LALKQAGKNLVKLTDDRDAKDLGMKHAAIKGFLERKGRVWAPSGMSQKPVIGARLMVRPELIQTYGIAWTEPL
jgi:hypothetical protein